MCQIVELAVPLELSGCLSRGLGSCSSEQRVMQGHLPSALSSPAGPTGAAAVAAVANLDSCCAFQVHSTRYLAFVRLAWVTLQVGQYQRLH